MATHKGVKILCISVIRISEQVWLMHRIYDEQNIIILDEELTKNWTILEDIYDILNVILIKYQDIRKIGISMPDIINHGSLLLFLEDFDC